jgi:serine/threonine-protein kinase RsbW
VGADHDRHYRIAGAILGDAMLAEHSTHTSMRCTRQAARAFSHASPSLERLPGEVPVFDPDHCATRQRRKETVAGQVMITSDWEQCRSLLDLVAHGAEAFGFDETAVCGIRVALEEALANAIKHGRRSDDDYIRVDYKFRGDGFRIRVTDQGPGFDPESVPDPTLPENVQRPTGRGLLLMRHYMTGVRYNERGNSVEMWKLRDESDAWGPSA